MSQSTPIVSLCESCSKPVKLICFNPSGNPEDNDIDIGGTTCPVYLLAYTALSMANLSGEAMIKECGEYTPKENIDV